MAEFSASDFATQSGVFQLPAKANHAPATIDGLVVTREKITIDGKEIPLPCSVADLEKVLGKSSQKEGDSYFWDDRGIRVQDMNTNNLVDEVGFFFSTQPQKNTNVLNTKHAVKESFKKKVTINGIEISNATNVKHLKDNSSGITGPSGNERYMWYISNDVWVDIFTDDHAAEHIAWILVHKKK